MSENVRESLREEEVKKIVEIMDDEYNMSKVADMIKDNKIEFEFGGKQYRVRLLNSKEKDDLDTLRRKKFGNLLQDKDILLEKDLIRIYKERGIDVDSIDKKIRQIQIQISAVQYKMGVVLENNGGDTVLNTYKNEVVTLKQQMYELIIQKNHLLNFSLENQLKNYEAKIISYLSLEVKQGDTWVKAYTNIDNFLVSDEKLINMTVSYSLALHY